MMELASQSEEGPRCKLFSREKSLEPLIGDSRLHPHTKNPPVTFRKLRLLLSTNCVVKLGYKTMQSVARKRARNFRSRPLKLDHAP